MHRKQGRLDSLYSIWSDNWTVLRALFNSQITLYQSKVRRLFVQQFYHDKASTNFLKHLIYIGEINPENSNNKFKYPGIGKKYYAYKKDF